MLKSVSLLARRRDLENSCWMQESGLLAVLAGTISNREVRFEVCATFHYVA